MATKKTIQEKILDFILEGKYSATELIKKAKTTSNYLKNVIARNRLKGKKIRYNSTSGVYFIAKK